MKVKFTHLWTSLLATYWFIPTLMVAVAVMVALALTAFEKRVDVEAYPLLGWTYSGGPEGSRQVLSTIASAVMNTAGVAFTVTIAALSLASGQFGPRLLDNFMRDRGNQVVLGTFVSTFLYCLLVLRTARGDDEVDRFVPQLATTVGVGLAGASIAAFIYFIHHVAISIQAPHVVALVAADLRRRIATRFPAELTAREHRQIAGAHVPPGLEEEGAEVPAMRDGYLQAIDEEGLVRTAAERDAVFSVERRAGHFLVRGQALVRVWPPDRLDDALADRLRGYFFAGERRTHEQDVEFAVNQLVELAVRALSPSVNDPFTANQCLDRLGAALCQIVRRQPPPRLLFDETDVLRVVFRRPLDFGGLVNAAFNPIRQNAAGAIGTQPAVVIRLMETIALVMRCTEDPEHRKILVHHAEMVYRSGMEHIYEEADRADLEARYRACMRAADARNSPMADAALERE
jgi:uncharacterized membrane protein